jgi:hypothetical protein
MVDDMIEMHQRGVSIDNNPTNVLYHFNDGFSIIDALPSSKIIEEGDRKEEYRVALQISDQAVEGDEVNIELLDLDVRHNVYDSSVAEHLFSAAKFIAYALIANLPEQGAVCSDDQYLHEIGFQKIFLPCLYQVMGIVKTEYPDLFPDFFSHVQGHFEKLKQGCQIGKGFNFGVVSYYNLPDGQSMADDLEIAVVIKEILDLNK